MELQWQAQVVLGVLSMVGAFGQAQPEPLRFDVISVKPPPVGRWPGARHGCTGDRFSFAGLPLTSLFRWAYNLPPTRMVGLPDWVTDWVNKTDSMYEIEAKASTVVDEMQCKAMVQSLLADRFKMVGRVEPREIRVFELTVDKKGHKMHLVNPGSPSMGVKLRGVPMRTQTELLAGFSMADFAKQLSSVPALTYPVVDKTGLAGIYSFNLNWSIKDDDGLPAMTTAVEEQLGLKLVPSKAVMDVLVVSHMERPTAN
jgi:uncharacterized protein (TIGR03435 family)